MKIILSCIIVLLLSFLGSPAEGFFGNIKMGFNIAHFVASSLRGGVTEDINDTISITNRSRKYPITIKDIKIIERSTGNNVANLTGGSCLFNPEAPIPVTKTLPFRIAPLGKIVFSVARCLEGVPRKNESSFNAGSGLGGTERDIQAFVAIVTIKARDKSHILGRRIRTRRVRGGALNNAFLGQNFLEGWFVK